MARKSPKRLSTSEIGDMRQKLNKTGGISWLRYVRKYRSLKRFGKRIGGFWPLSLLLVMIITGVFRGAFYASVTIPERTLDFLGIQERLGDTYPTISNQGNIQLVAEASNAFEKLGPVGDFFGGITNPLLSFITVIILLLSLRTQRQELANTRAELARTAEANEKLVDLQEEQLKASIQSVNALNASAEAHLRNIDVQLQNLSLQRHQLEIETKLSIIREINIQIESREKSIRSYLVNPSLIKTDIGERDYWPNHESLTDLRIERLRLNQEIQRAMHRMG